jgi:CheY-like chemotaxis protein
MKNVLIVDDEQIILDVLQRILLRLGYDAVVSDSGELAIEKFLNEEFDLVLMDILMPEMSGFDVARKMREIKPDQKIVIVTGLGTDAAIAQADLEQIDIDDVLPKPFSFENVRLLLDREINNNQYQHEPVLYTN